MPRCQAAADALATGGTQQVAELAELEARFGSLATSELVALIQPIIPAAATAALADASTLLISRFRNEVQYNVSQALAQSVVQGEGIAQAARRLGRSMDGEQWRLERIARTEIGNAMNAGHQATIEQVAAQFPEMGLQKQWSAHLDSRTSARCRGLHLQVRETAQLFTAQDGWQGMNPPAHPNCRSRVVAYSPRWERTGSQKVAEQGAGTSRNQELTSRPTRVSRTDTARTREPQSPNQGPGSGQNQGSASNPKRASGAQAWVSAARAQIAQGTATEAEIRAVGSIARQELLRRTVTPTRDDVRGLLSEFRPIGGAPFNSSGGPADVLAIVQDAFDLLPYDWQNLSNLAGPLAVDREQLGIYRHTVNLLSIDGQGQRAASVALHELGHRMEVVVPRLRDLERQFYNRRTAGEALQPLGLPNPATAMHRPDNFTHPYIGRDYSGFWYEIISMGLDGVYYGQNGVRGDVELFDLVLGVLVTL